MKVKELRRGEVWMEHDVQVKWIQRYTEDCWLLSGVTEDETDLLIELDEKEVKDLAAELNAVSAMQRAWEFEQERLNK